jgi:hypothetical protein
MLNLDGPASRHEEHWRGRVRVEIKAGKKAKPIQTWWRKVRDRNRELLIPTRIYIAITAELAVIRLHDFARLLDGDRADRTWIEPHISGRPVETFYRNCRAQSDASAAIGDTRPFVAVAAPDGTGMQYAVLRVDDLAKILEAL